MENMNKEKYIFTVSLVILAVFYGVVAERIGIFPSHFIDSAARVVKTLNRDTTKPISIGKKVHDFTGVKVHQQSGVATGTTLLTSEWEQGGRYKPELRLINKHGEILHRWQVNRSNIFEGDFFRRSPENADIHGSHLTKEGSVIVNLEYLGAVKINSCNEVVWSLPELNHHSIEVAKNGGFWIPSTSDMPKFASANYADGFSGLEGKKVWLDSIQKVSEDGEVVKQFNILDILYKNGLQKFLVKTTGASHSLSKMRQDVTHINDVEELPENLSQEYPMFDAGDLLVSLRNPSLAFVFDPETRKVKWYSSEHFLGQHDPDFVGGGWIGVFDNNRDFTHRGTMSGGSRIVYLQPHTKNVKVVLSSENTDHFYTPIRGKWQNLENGNMLITEAQAGHAFEVDQNGEIVWEWAHKSIGDTQQVPSLAQAKRYNINKEDVAAWRCSDVKKSD